MNVYTRTRVDAHVGMKWDGPWGGALSDFAYLLQQFNGSRRPTASAG